MRKTVAMLDELPADGKQTVIGLPAQECTTLTLTLPTADESLFADMAFAQLEKRGLAPAGYDSTVFAYHIIERQPGESQISVDVLPPDFNEDLCVREATGYVSAARPLPHPRSQSGCLPSA